MYGDNYAASTAPSYEPTAVMEQVVEAEKILEKLRAAIKLRTADVDGVR
jgi:hypothetical protein